jgi:hypothetical protein
MGVRMDICSQSNNVMITAGCQEKNDRKSITLQRSSEAIFKRPYEDMGDCNQRNVRRNLQDIVKDGWDMISKNQALGSLDKIMKEIYTVKTDGLLENMRSSVKAAYDQKNKNLLIQLLSLTEDGELVVQLIALALKNHKQFFPHADECILKTDGAGCFTGIKSMARYGYVGMVTGIKTKIVYTRKRWSGHKLRGEEN